MMLYLPTVCQLLATHQLFLYRAQVTREGQRQCHLENKCHVNQHHGESQLDRIQKTTENIHVLDGLRRIVTFLIVAPYKYSYLLTYLLTHLTEIRVIHLCRNINISTVLSTLTMTETICYNARAVNRRQPTSTSFNRFRRVITFLARYCFWYW